MGGTERYDLPHSVRPEPYIAHLVPRYLERRHADVAALEEALLAGNHSIVQSLGHSMRGSGAGYGFDAITEIGARMEDAVKEGDLSAMRHAVEDLKAYLRNVRVLYEGEG